MAVIPVLEGYTGGSKVQVHPGIHRGLEASLGYTRPSLKNNKEVLNGLLAVFLW